MQELAYIKAEQIYPTIENHQYCMQENCQPHSQKINYQNMYCSQRNQAEFFCSTKGCKNFALVCGKRKCKCMSLEHPNCDISLAQNLLQRILVKNEPLTKELLQTVTKIQTIYQETIAKLSQQLESIRVWKDNFGLSVEEAKLTNLIKLNDESQLNGDLVQQVKAKIQEKQDFTGLTIQYVDLTWNRQKPKYIKVFEKIMNMVKTPPKAGKFDFEWDNETKRANVKIQDKCICLTQSQGSAITFMKPDLKIIASDKSIKWAAKIKELSGYDGGVGMGICFNNRIFNCGMSLQSLEKRSYGHGVYIVMSSGYVFSHSVQNQNLERNPNLINLKENDVVNVCYQPRQRKLKLVKNNQTARMIVFEGIEDPPQGDFYTPCVSITGKHTVIQIVEPNQDINWQDKPILINQVPQHLQASSDIQQQQ